MAPVALTAFLHTAVALEHMLFALLLLDKLNVTLESGFAPIIWALAVEIPVSTSMPTNPVARYAEYFNVSSFDSKRTTAKLLAVPIRDLTFTFIYSYLHLLKSA